LERRLIPSGIGLELAGVAVTLEGWVQVNDEQARGALEDGDFSPDMFESPVKGFLHP
jgi:hypothetical protein